MTPCPTCTAVRAALGEHCTLTTADGETIEIEPAEAIGYLLHALSAVSQELARREVRERPTTKETP